MKNITSQSQTSNSKKMLQFNKNANQYEIRRKFTYPEAIYERLYQTCTKHELALDLGCGNGVSAARLTKYFRQVDAVDIGDQLIANARTHNPEINFTVKNAEEFINENKYDLITSATSFYWMDREKVLANIKNMLTLNGVFCAYKYDVPIIYGPIRDLINYEFANKWYKFRDPRLLEYDNTIEVLNDSKIFRNVYEFIEANIIELTPEEIALTFLSTSYVTSYIENTHNENYPIWLINECIKAHNKIGKVKVRSDIYGYIGIGLR